MGTLYKKVSVSDRTPKKNGRYFVWINEPNADNDEDRMFKTIYKDGFGFQSFYEVTHWLEEIPDNSHKIEKLEAEKKEMVNMLERCENRITPTENHSSLLRDLNELIQKHKND